MKTTRVHSIKTKGEAEKTYNSAFQFSLLAFYGAKQKLNRRVVQLYWGFSKKTVRTTVTNHGVGLTNIAIINYIYASQLCLTKKTKKNGRTN